MDRRKYLRAYVRTDKRGKITPGSLTLLNKLPRTPGFKEVTDPGVNLCYCGDTEACAGAPYWYNLAEAASVPIPKELVGKVSVVDSSCNIYTVGTYRTVDVTQYTQYLLKNDKNGTPIWTKFITGEESNGEVVTMHIDSQDNLYIATNLSLTKLDSDGNIIWSKGYPTDQTLNGALFMIDMAVCPNDSVFLLAYSESEEGGAVLAKINPSTGDVLLQKNFSNPVPYSLGDAYCMYFDNNSDLIIPFITNQPNWNSILTKIDGNLNVLWSKYIDTYNLASLADGDAPDVRVDANNDILLVGYEGYLSKISSDGTPLWTIEAYCSAPDSSDYKIQVVTDKDNSIYWSGVLDLSTIYGVPSNGNGWVVLKLNPDGTLVHATGFGYNSSTEISFDVWGYSEPPRCTMLQRGCFLLALDGNYVGSSPFFLTSAITVMRYPTNTQVIGTYGDILFTDVTSFYNPIFYLPPAVDVTLIETPLVVSPVDATRIVADTAFITQDLNSL